MVCSHLLRYFFTKYHLLKFMFCSFFMSIHYIHVFGTHLKLKEKKIVTVIRKVCPSDL